MAQTFYDSNYTLGQAYMEVMGVALASNKPGLTHLAETEMQSLNGDTYQKIMSEFNTIADQNNPMKSILIKIKKLWNEDHPED